MRRSRSRCCATRRLCEFQYRRSARQWVGQTGPRDCNILRPTARGQTQCWLDGGHNPSAAPGGRVRQTAFQRRDAAARHLCEPDDQGPAGMLEPFKAWRTRSTPCRPVPVASRRRSRRRRSRARLQRRCARGRGAGSGGYPERGSRLIFGSLYLAGSVLAANDRCRPRLSRAVELWRQRRAGLPRTRIHSRITNSTANAPAAAVQRNTVA